MTEISNEAVWRVCEESMKREAAPAIPPLPTVKEVSDRAGIGHGVGDWDMADPDRIIEAAISIYMERVAEAVRKEVLGPRQ